MVSAQIQDLKNNCVSDECVFDPILQHNIKTTCRGVKI